MDQTRWMVGGRWSMARTLPVARTFMVRVLVAFTLVAAVSCGGGGSSSSPAPTPTPTPTPGGGSSTTITISSSGVSPATLTVSPGTRVTFVNNDSRAHEMDSNPHPEHTDCIEINQVGFLNPNQSKESGNLTTVRTCGYHDHNDPDNARWKGSIVIR
jgi:plastocyanin